MTKIEQILVLGLGKSGRAALQLANKQGIKTIAFDEAESIEKPPFCNEFYPAYINGLLPKADLIVISPGIGRKSPLRKAATESGIRIVSELEFASYFTSVPLIAVTGTNGKTTTTELTEHLLTSLGYKTVAAGNIGNPLSLVLAENMNPDFIVLEVSSFQLESIKSMSFHVAALLNIESDHMDRYESFDEYCSIKFSIFKNVSSLRSIVRHDLVKKWKTFINNSSLPVTFSVCDQNANYFSDGNVIFKYGQPLIDISKSQLKGIHNIENMLASLALVFSTLENSKELDLKVLGSALNEFRAGAHRMELVLVQDGVTYIDDSKATNPDSVRAALRTINGEKNVLLVAGGLDKDMDFSPILEQSSKIKKAFLIGQSQKKLFTFLKNVVDCVLCDTFKCAVNSACNNAEPGDVVLLSPACASMDMFKDYKDRGETFKKLVKRRLKK